MAASEGDIYDLFAEPRGDIPVHLLIRACHEDRVLLPPTAQQAATAAEAEEAVQQSRHLRERVLAAPILFNKEISGRGRESTVACDKRARRQPRKSRTAQAQARAATVTMRPPWPADP